MFDYCDYCGNFEYVEEMNKGKFICNDCINRLKLKYCNNCNKYYSDKAYEVYDVDEKSGELKKKEICEKCFENTFSYFKCKECGRWISRKIMNHVFFLDDNSDKDGYCPECCKDSIRPILYTYSDSFPFCDHYQKKYHPIELENDPNEINGKRICFGIEIELDNGGTSPFNAQLLLNQLGSDFAIVDLDASLDSGLEFDTFPISWYQYLNMGYKERIASFLTIARKMGYETGSTTGMHIHVSKSVIPNNKKIDLDRFLTKFFYKYREDLLRISGREDESTYALFPQDEEPEYDSRYKAVNLISTQDTIEFRFFGGTMLMSLINARIEFCLSLIKYAMRCNYNLKVIDKFTFEELLTQMGLTKQTHCGLTMRTLISIALEKEEIENVPVSKSFFHRLLAEARERFRR